MASNDDKDWLRQDFLDLVSKFGELERRLSAEIAEYKKTVNTAIGMLSQESFEFQARRNQDRAEDTAERKARQRRQDIKDVIIALIGLLTLFILCSIIALLVYLVTQKVVIV